MFVFIATAVIIPFLIIAVAYLICTRGMNLNTKSNKILEYKINFRINRLL